MRPLKGEGSLEDVRTSVGILECFTAPLPCIEHVSKYSYQWEIRSIAGMDIRVFPELSKGY